MINKQNDVEGFKIEPLIQNAEQGNLLSLFDLYHYFLSGDFVIEANPEKAKKYLYELKQKIHQAKFKIDCLTMYEFKRFNELKITFDPQLTVIIGDNGAGKTSIIEGVARLLSWLSSRMIKANSRGKSILLHEINLQATDYAELNAHFKLNEQTNFELSLLTKFSGWDGNVSSDVQVATSIGELYRLLSQEDDSFTLPLFACYLVDRSNIDYAFKIDEVQGVQQFFNSRFNAYINALDASAKLETFLKQYIELYNLSVEAPVNEQKMYYQNALSQVNKAIQTIVPHIKNIIVDRSDGSTRLKVESFNQMLDFNSLSQGQKTLAGMVGDIALRMSVLNPHLENVLEADGIILIDEIDLHLHPKLQQTVLLNLGKVFPNIQFIVTTHSPQVLSTVDKKQIRLLSFTEDGQATVESPQFQTKGVISSDVLEQIMDTVAVPEIAEALWVEKYGLMIQQGNWEDQKAKELKHNIYSHFGKNHPIVDDLESKQYLEELKINFKQLKTK